MSVADFWDASHVGAGGHFGDPRAGRKHRGTDYSHGNGTAIPSPLAGTVVGELSPAPTHGFGFQVTVRAASGATFSFSHMQAASPLSIGQTIAVGDTLGLEGRTGATTGPCVHVEYNGGAGFSDPAPRVADLVSAPPAAAGVIPAGTGGVAAPAFPLPAGSYFGPKSGPAASVSGYFSHREDFRVWQQRMSDRGWVITADGLYGDQSAGIALAFQIQKNLGRDSLVGPETWSAAWTEPIT